MRAGKLDRLITIRRKTLTASASGGQEETWTVVVQRRAAGYLPIRGTEGFTAPEVVAKQQVEFQIRYSSDVAALEPNRNDIVFPALDDDELGDDPPANRIFNVLGVLMIGRNEGLRIVAERRPDAA